MSENSLEFVPTHVTTEQIWMKPGILLVRDLELQIDYFLSWK